MKRRRATGLAAMAGALWLCATIGAARVEAQRRLPPPTRVPALNFEGRAVLRELAVVIHCESESSGVVACRARTEVVVLAEEPTSICAWWCSPTHASAPPHERDPAATLSIDGRPYAGPRALSQGESVTVVSAQTYRYDVGRRGLGEPPLGVRHPVLGESWLYYERARTEALPLASGSIHRVEGPVELTVSGTSSAHVFVGAERVRGRASLEDTLPRVTIEIHAQGAPADGPLAHGGPAITLAGRSNVNYPYESRFSMSVGYELGLVDYLILSAWFETDFDSISEAVLIEAAIPGVLYFLPSLSFGVGLVARQLGQRDADAAFRMRVGASWLFVGFFADLDYWPVTTGWTATIGAKLGL